jgi:hypothetical protein
MDGNFISESRKWVTQEESDQACGKGKELETEVDEKTLKWVSYTCKYHGENLVCKSNRR